MMSTIVMLYASSVSTNRWSGAKCVERRDLPWTSDTTPLPEQATEMASVCHTCPVLTQCALYALKGADGGFYAGVWIPWDHTTSPTLRLTRRQARTTLRHMVSA